VAATHSELSTADKRVLAEPRDWGMLKNELAARQADSSIGAVARKLTGQLRPLPRSVFDLTNFYARAMVPREVAMEALWGMLHLILKVSFFFPPVVVAGGEARVEGVVVRSKG
jgi:hypothetical protein